MYSGLGDPKQTSGGTGPSDLARKVRLISDQLALGIRAPRTPYLPQALPRLIQSLLLDPLHTAVAVPSEEIPDTGAPSAHDGGPCPVAVNPHMRSCSQQMRPDDRWHMHSWLSLVACRCDGHTAGDPDAWREQQRRHNWSVMLPVSKRVQAGVYALMAVSRYRDALVLKPTLGGHWSTSPLSPMHSRPASRSSWCHREHSMHSRLWHVMFTSLWRYFCNSARSIQS